MIYKVTLRGDKTLIPYRWEQSLQRMCVCTWRCCFWRHGKPAPGQTDTCAIQDVRTYKVMHVPYLTICHALQQTPMLLRQSVDKHYDFIELYIKSTLSSNYFASIDFNVSSLFHWWYRNVMCIHFTILWTFTCKVQHSPESPPIF